jgi:peroxiredoxin
MKLKLVVLASIVALAVIAAFGSAGAVIQDQAKAPAPTPPPPPPAAVQPMVLGFPMPDFTLPAIQGGAFGPSALKGKNVLIVFPRGKVDDTWCWLCHYQYAELADLEARLGLRKAYNLEVLFVLPYGEAEVRHWADIFPAQMAEIQKWLNPPGAESFTGQRKERLDRIRQRFAGLAEYAKGPVATPFPILYDQDQAVSKRLGLFTQNWDHSAVDQNVPTAVLLNTSGDIVFKYASQNTTFDRPSGAYLVRMMAELLEPAGPPPAKK